MKSRGGKGLAERYRPRTFSEVVGDYSAIAAARRLLAKGDEAKRPTAWLLHGGSGSGKTTLARIIALSMNCSHQKVFGDPCVECRRHQSQFEITEINAADLTGIDDMREFVHGGEFYPSPPSTVKAFILDEAHKLSEATQNLLLKPLESGPATTIWFLCTTEPTKLKITLRRRCVSLKMEPYKLAEVRRLVTAVYEKESGKQAGNDITKFCSQLYENGVLYPGLIMSSLETFMATGRTELFGAQDSPEVIDLCRALMHGKWSVVSKGLAKTEASDLYGLRCAALGYFTSVLKNNPLGSSNRRVVSAIRCLTFIPASDTPTLRAQMFAEFYSVCELFKAR